MAESLNSRIAAVKLRACGFRNVENFRTAIYFYCGGLEMYPC
ncbi:MAG TPA: transposase [bacterium]